MKKRFMLALIALVASAIFASPAKAETFEEYQARMAGESSTGSDDSTIASGEGRYASLNTPLQLSISLGWWGQKHGEEGWWVSPEAYINDGEVWQKLGLPGNFRFNVRGSYSRVHGGFDTSPASHVRYEQDRIRFAIGGNWVFASHNWRHALEVNLLWQGEWAREMKRSDRQDSERSFTNIPEARVTYSTSILPQLLRPDHDAYTAFEVIANYNTDSDVTWLRGTLKYEFLSIGDTSRATFRDMVLNNAPPDGQTSWLSLRAGPRVQGYGGRQVPHVYKDAGIFVEAFFSKGPISLGAYVGGGDRGLVTQFEVYFAF